MVAKPIYLVGLPGSGKSTFGHSIAKYLKRDLIDLDMEIENAEEMSISNIFKSKGEKYFREVEKNTLQTFDSGEIVVATGGGAPCFFDNMDFMLKHGITVFLDLSMELILSRLENDADDKRPLFEGKNIAKALQELDAKRRPFYKRSQFTFTEKDDINHVFRAIESSH
ncbi:MAG: shikimate kinase [Bacteroidota bacterium]